VFAELRARIEERILGVEQRNVRTLEQLSETVALIERRFSEDDERTLPPRVVALKARVRAADAILIATPEYNYSVPGVLKNAIDWASRPYGDNVWDGKPVALMGASPGPHGTARAQYHLRQSFVFLNMYPVNRPEVMISNATQRFDAQGHLADEALRARIRQLLEALVAWTRRLRTES